MQVKNDISRGLTRTITEAAEAWQADHGDLVAVRDVDYLVREALRICQFLREWRDELWRTALANEVADLDAAGLMLRGALDQALEALKAVSACVHDAEHLGHQAANAAELDQAAVAVQQLRDDFVKRWPWINWQLLEQARTAHERGETIPLEEAFDELPGRAQ